MSLELELKQNIDGLGRAFEEFKTTQEKKVGEKVDCLVEEKSQKIIADFTKKFEQAEQKIAELTTAVSRPGAGSKTDADPSREMKSAYRKFLAKGEDRMSPEEVKSLQGEVKALTGVTDAEGGFMIRPEISNDIIQAQAPMSIMRQLANVRGIATDAIEFFDDAGEFEAAWVGEVDPRPETGTSTLARRTIAVHEIYAQPFVSQKMLEDAVFGVEQYVNEKIARAFSVKEEAAFWAGTGVGQPKGVLTYAAGTTTGTIQNIGSAAGGAITGDNIIDLIMSLSEEDQANATIVAHRTAIGATLKLKDTTGQYLWNLGGLAAGAPATLLGRPVRSVSTGLQAVGTTGNVPMVAGNWNRAYMILDRIGISMLRDPFTSKPYVKFYTRKRVGGDVTATAAIKRLVLTA